MINPYELFGLDPQKVTIKDLKRKYYELALMVHPDRTNNPDGSEMNIVHKAYKYCEHEILHTQSKEQENPSVEDLEKRFKDFCTSQEEQPPSFRDIMEDALELRSFHEQFENSKNGFKAAYASGYGDYMDASEYTVSSKPTPDTLPKPTYDPMESQPPSKPFSTAIIKYSEFINPSCTKSDFYSYSQTDPLANYTKMIKKLCLSDYKEAHSKEDLDTSNLPPEKTLEQLVAKRERDQQFFEVMNKELLLPAVLPRLYTQQ